MSTLYNSLFFLFFFFFSSRRRHTSWNCDWSSDVCSSDLLPFEARKSEHLHPARSVQQVRQSGDAVEHRQGLDGFALACAQGLFGTRAKSEERRVGKECRSRWSRYH